jgi:hypothetical protein
MSQATPFKLVFSSAYSTLKMKAVCSSEISVYFQRATQRYITQDNTPHKDRRKNFKSYFKQQNLPIKSIRLVINTILPLKNNKR